MIWMSRKWFVRPRPKGRGPKGRGATLKSTMRYFKLDHLSLITLPSSMRHESKLEFNVMLLFFFKFGLERSLVLFIAHWWICRCLHLVHSHIQLVYPSARASTHCFSNCIFLQQKNPISISIWALTDQTSADHVSSANDFQPWVDSSFNWLSSSFRGGDVTPPSLSSVFTVRPVSWNALDKTCHALICHRGEAGEWNWSSEYHSHDESIFH